MRLSNSLNQNQHNTQRIDPRQILSSEIMSWSNSELESAIDKELAQNPALETRDDNGLYGRYGSEVGGIGVLSSLSETGPRSMQLSLAHTEDGLADPFDRVARTETLTDYLRSQVSDTKSMYPCINVRVLYFVIDSVNDKGYLDVSVEDIVTECGCTFPDANEAIEALQSMNPPGVGARDLRECMTLQLKHLANDGQGSRLVLKIITEHWDDFTANRERQLCAKLSLTPTRYEQCVNYIRTSLCPYPSSGFRSSHNRTEVTHVVRPEIVFTRTEAGIQVQLARDFSKDIIVNADWAEINNSKSVHKDDSSQRYVKEHVDRATSFVSGVARRGKTLQAIARIIAEEQLGFIETQNRTFLRPFTRQYLSERLQLDESVISRAVADKWAMLPSGDLMPLEGFFGNSDAVREALLDLLTREDKNDPYSDEDIAALLTERGFPVARRTVAKYRSLERLLPARLRKGKAA